EIGPDGALYIAGWGSVYGTEYVPKEKWTPEENAKYQGRVFRLIHKESPLIPRTTWDTAKRKKDIESWSFGELVEDLGSDLHVWRVHAQDELIRRGDEVRNDLLAAIRSGQLSKTQATWAMWAIGHIAKARGQNHEQVAQFASGQWHSTKNASRFPLASYRLNVRIQATRILGENGVRAAAPLLIKLLADQEPRIRLAAMGSLDRIGWGNNSATILDVIAYETDRVAYYTSWQ
ncbi:MAG: HEAT repeat domain-containing protein, partial [Planctomycetaceae bacterium]|nr:HEAT repeat domain-containing protein [Planctomycetaceae bacterium]